MENYPKIKVFALHYKPDSDVVAASYPYENIWAGKNENPETSRLTGDDQGQNISYKNKYYSELTGHYWIWKNTAQDVVGCCHYRRFFTNTEEPLPYKIKRGLYYLVGIWKKRYGLIYTNQPDRWKDQILSCDEISEILKDYDAILPVRRKLRYTVREHYRRYHNIADLDIIEDILRKDYPEYGCAFENVMNNSRLFANNMLILNNENFDRLMVWLFDIFSKFEERVNLADYEDYQQRIIGFLSERLITVWIQHHNIRYKELPLIYFKKLKNEE